MEDRQCDASDSPRSNAQPFAAKVAVVQQQQQNPSIARSMSRYRRNRPVVAVNSATLPAPPAPSASTISERVNTQGLSTQPGNRVPLASKELEEEEEREKHRQNAMAQLTGESKTTNLAASQTGRARKDALAGGTSPPHESLVQTTPLRSGLTIGQPAKTTPSDPNRRSILQKVGLARSKPNQFPAKDSSAGSAKPNYIGVGGGGIVPGTDAPISAVNAGERLVMVQYGDSSAKLPVTPTTSVEDLLKVAARRISRQIDPTTSILMESFHQIQLERPLRRYERVRDVMNSWAVDTDGALLVVPTSSLDTAAPLEASSVSSDQPPETTVYCYYSHRPRKWDKRFVTLHSDGHVTVSKKEHSKDSTSVCHLTDFDIYIPSPRYAAKEIKPPKKICFAIKSQQKSSMFLSTDSFVHFFCTNDRAVGDKWYRAVQSWRSWYLVKKVRVAEPVMTSDQTDPKPSLVHSATRRVPPNQGSSEMPRLDRQNSEPESAQRSSERPQAEAMVFRRKTTREHRPPPSSFPATLTLDTKVVSSKSGSITELSSADEEQEPIFASSGLLGRTYTQRQQAMREREDRAKKAQQDPFGKSGLIGASPASAPAPQPSSRTNTLTRADAAAAQLDWTMSISQGQKPLVDLTPKFVEPPQHLRKGRGVRVEPGRQLIDAATGPESIPGVVNVPSSTTWKRPPVEPSSQSQPHRSNTTKSSRANGTVVQYSAPHSAGPISTSADTFHANSLLANASRQTSTHPHHSKVPAGRGVATGDRDATRPLLDMSDENPFTDGSLLKQL